MEIKDFRVITPITRNYLNVAQVDRESYSCKWHVNKTSFLPFLVFHLLFVLPFRLPFYQKTEFFFYCSGITNLLAWRQEIWSCVRCWACHTAGYIMLLRHQRYGIFGHIFAYRSHCIPHLQNDNGCHSQNQRGTSFRVSIWSFDCLWWIMDNVQCVCSYLELEVVNF